MAPVRLTVFWERMTERFGARQADTIARDQVMRQLDGQTVQQALAAGWSARAVWNAVCEAYEVPVAER